MVKNMVFVTEKYVFIDSRTNVNEEIGEMIKSLPKTFILQCKNFCPFITEYSYNEHTKEAILVCRFKNEKDFCETTRMDNIANFINMMHECIANHITCRIDKILRECGERITNIININDESSCEVLDHEPVACDNDE